MTADPVRAIAQAVLYEGYLLWPYRRSALKNQQRFTFGGVYPEAFASQSSDRHAIRMECLIAGARPEVEVELRFLQLVEVPGWQEAVERDITIGPLAARAVRDVRIEAGGDLQIRDGSEVPRSWSALRGRLEAAIEPRGGELHRLSVSFANRSTSETTERPEALRQSFLSAHFVARVAGGAFVSSTDPPDADEAARCANEGVWPVLVGEDGSRDTMLGSPIILSDYPQVAPESPGDLFDGGEIDALLIHSIRALSDAERAEMAATDPRAREILERSMALPPEKMLELWAGAVRELRPLED